MSIATVGEDQMFKVTVVQQERNERLGSSCVEKDSELEKAKERLSLAS